MNDRQITEKTVMKNLETNSSDHYPVSISVLSSYTEIKDKLKADQHTSLCKTRIKWDKVDKERYSQLVTTNLEQLQYDNKDSQFGLESITETICDILVTSAKKCYPQKKQNKNKPKLKVWNADISSALKDSRTARKNWLQAGKPNDPTHPTCMEKKLCKKKFRSCCRIEIAQKFIKNKEDIMQAKRYDNTLFYKLINKQRGSSSSVITDLTVGEQCFSGEENVLDGFKLHFQNLATKQNDNEYDENFYNQVEYDYDIIGELTSLKNIQPVTLCELQKAIDSLNKGKAPDIYGLTVENILFGGSTIKTLSPKTEVMLISNIFYDYDLRLTYDNTRLNIVETHKHLGIHLSSNNKWTKHIDSVISSASKQVSYLRKLKYQLNKRTLNKLYFIRPLLEYGAEIWDGCSMADANRLEQIQMNAARIVTGLPVFASLNSLYFETGWETLADRRRVRKLTLMYKIVNNDVPSYLLDLLPNRVNETNIYNLRNNTDFVIPFTRLCSYESSFFPSTLKLWNDLDTPIRNLPTLPQFKTNIMTIREKIADHTIVGERRYSIILTRIRHRCSSLKADLFRVNIINNPSCSCGAPFESAEHYFFECELYNEQRNILLQNLNPIINVSFPILTSGSPDCNVETNKMILQTSIKYIKDTHRFD